jgi:hypothetical protein
MKKQLQLLTSRQLVNLSIELDAISSIEVEYVKQFPMVYKLLKDCSTALEMGVNILSLHSELRSELANRLNDLIR